MQILYPEIKPYAEHSLEVSDIHNLYIEECGSPDGIPVVFIHGGPGGGCNSDHRRFFDPEKYRIILFDQRGCGRSTPHASLVENTSQDLINDMEAIRVSLDVDRWMLFGGSWGSTLALLYSESFPDRVSAMVLRGIFLGRESDNKWLYQEGANCIYPDYWEDFCTQIPEAERGDLLTAYYKRLTGTNELARMSSAKAWSLWEARMATLHTSHKVIEQSSEPHFALSLACIEAHYFVNKCFISENQVLENIDKINNIPGIIVHGRYDIICPLENAWSLHHAWPVSELHIVRDAGHSAGEAGNIDALVRATRTMAKRLED
ncbi:MAG: prolyl aminopeptidase [Gammaproteobacteria bacterium]|nr:prolyl aminopeptidase [Gammaproteobacteria bacterium]